MELYTDKNITVTVPAATVRAIDVAAAAKHKLLIISNDPILSLLAADGVIAIAMPCPCGYYKNPRGGCICDPEDIVKHIRELRIKYAKYMYTECAFVYQRNVKFQGLDQTSLQLMKHAYQELCLTMAQTVIITETAEAIAKMENAKEIEACHIAEAISYRMPKD